MKQITRGEYLQILGLLLLAKKHTRIIDDLREELETITGETTDSVAGHCSDAVAGCHEYSADELLLRLKITVAE